MGLNSGLGGSGLLDWNQINACANMLVVSIKVHHSEGKKILRDSVMYFRH